MDEETGVAFAFDGRQARLLLLILEADEKTNETYTYVTTGIGPHPFRVDLCLISLHTDNAC